jgi:UDP-galactopyranose mutase
MRAFTRAVRCGRDNKRGCHARQYALGRRPAPGNAPAVRCVLVEGHCDYTERHLERYNPVKIHDGRHGRTYAQYKALADAEAKLTFIGGIYQHLDMHQVINQSLRGAHVWMDAA